MAQAASADRILIVDDDPTNRDILKELLAEQYCVAFAVSGEEALSAAETFKPDLILLDIMMPGLDGYEVCRRLRQSPSQRYAKVLLVSAKALVAERLLGYEAGADDYITKPFAPDELEAKVRVFLRLKSVEEQDAEKSRTLDLLRERTEELEASREEYRSLVEATSAVPWQLDAHSLCFSYVGPQGAALIGCESNEWLAAGFLESRLHPDEKQLVLDRFRSASHSGGDTEFEFRMRRDDGTWSWIHSLVSACAPVEGSRMRGLLIDITARRQLEIELRQAQKLESIGRLAGGVAHEINTPVQFVSDSVHFLREAFKDLASLLDKYGEMKNRTGRDDAAALRQEIAAAEAEADLVYLRNEVPKALDRTLEGLGRISVIVRSMKEFASPDRAVVAPANINQALQTTLTIADHECRRVADVITDFGDLPPVVCNVAELNQAFLNIIVNAAHAVETVFERTGKKGRIQITTACAGDAACVTIADDGAGIPETIHGNIFDPFFTTKEVGKGTGQGLAVARNIIVDKHGGSLSFKSEEHRGTTFEIRLPLLGRQAVVTA